MRILLIKLYLMKHLKFLLLLLLAGQAAQTMNAHDFEVGGIYYNKNGSNAIVTYRGTNYDSYSNEYTGTVNIPSTVTYSGTTYSVISIGNGAFSGCSGLTSVTIPNSVTSIGSDAFYRCTGLTSVTIPNSVTTIAIAAFSGCTGLTSVTIPNSMTYIGYGTFSDCTGLTSVTIPNSVNFISGSAFDGCTGLTSVTIPNSVTTIGKYAFRNCTGLKKIYSNIVNPNNVTLGSEVFQEVNKNTCTLIVPVASYDLYKNASQWKDFLNIVRDVLVTSISIIPQMSLYLGQTYTLSATISPLNAYSVVNWTSSNTTIATIDHSGLVTAKKLGTATITATATDGSGVSASCIVNVTGIENITFNKSKTSIYVGGTETLTATITPGDVINNTLTWTSSDTNVATVDQSGLVTAKKLGTATITATATDGSGVSASCVVTVTGAESVTLNKEEVSMYIGDTETLTATVYPDGLINKTLSWSSSKTSVATVDQNGLVIARAPGTATIRATATDGSGVSASCVVNVVPEYTMSVDTVVHIRGTERVARTVDINLDNREAISGLQFDITLPNYVELATANGYPDMWLDDSRKARNHSVDINLIGAKKYRVVVSSPTNKTFKGNEGAILHFNVLVYRFPSIGNATINISDIVLAEADETQHTIGSVTSDVRFVYLVGDANADTRVDIADYVLTANKIMVRPVSNFWSDAANANYNDNTLNVTDLVAITNIALEMRGKEIRPAIDGFQFAPAVALPGIDLPLTARVVEMNADRTIVAISIDNNEAIAAMQLDLDLPDGVMLESASVTDRSHMLSATCGTSPEGLPRVMLSSFGINDINAGCGDVLYLTMRGKARQGELMSLTNAVMSERNLIEHGASGNLTLDLNDYTGVSTVVYDHVNIYSENGSIIIESPVEGTAQLVRINGMSREVKVEPGRNVYPVSSAHGDVIIAAFNGTTRKIQF